MKFISFFSSLLLLLAMCALCSPSASAEDRVAPEKGSKVEKDKKDSVGLYA